MTKRFESLISTRTNRGRKSSHERGLTLIEIMVVLVILALVMGFLASRIFGQGDRAKANITKLKLQEIKQKIGEYRLMYNALPSSLQDLTRCNEQTGQGCVPVMSDDDPQAFKDAWGGELVYQLGGNGRTFKIQSLGADGRTGGDQENFDFFEEGP